MNNILNLYNNLDDIKKKEFNDSVRSTLNVNQKKLLKLNLLEE